MALFGFQICLSVVIFFLYVKLGQFFAIPLWLLRKIPYFVYVLPSDNYIWLKLKNPTKDLHKAEEELLKYSFDVNKKVPQEFEIPTGMKLALFKNRLTVECFHLIYGLKEYVAILDVSLLTFVIYLSTYVYYEFIYDFFFQSNTKIVSMNACHLWIIACAFLLLKSIFILTKDHIEEREKSLVQVVGLILFFIIFSLILFNDTKLNTDCIHLKTMNDIQINGRLFNFNLLHTIHHFFLQQQKLSEKNYQGTQTNLIDFASTYFCKGTNDLNQNNFALKNIMSIYLLFTLSISMTISIICTFLLLPLLRHASLIALLIGDRLNSSEMDDITPSPSTCDTNGFRDWKMLKKKLIYILQSFLMMIDCSWTTIISFLLTNLNKKTTKRTPIIILILIIVGCAVRLFLLFYIYIQTHLDGSVRKLLKLYQENEPYSFESTQERGGGDNNGEIRHRKSKKQNHQQQTNGPCPKKKKLTNIQLRQIISRNFRNVGIVIIQILIPLLMLLLIDLSLFAFQLTSNSMFNFSPNNYVELNMFDGNEETLSVIHHNWKVRFNSFLLIWNTIPFTFINSFFNCILFNFTLFYSLTNLFGLFIYEKFTE